MFKFFKKKEPAENPPPDKPEEKKEEPEKRPHERPEEEKSPFSRLKRPERPDVAVRLPWWVRGLNWRELPVWGRVFIILGLVGIGLGIWSAVLSSEQPAPTYYLSLAVDPEKSGVVTHNRPDNKYLEGAEVTLTAESSPGYEFASWSGDASGISPVTTVKMDSNKSATAHFSVIRYDLDTTASPPEGGSVTPAGDSYDYGCRVTLRATPLPGYNFVHWLGDASGSSPVISLNMDDNKSVTAIFSLAQHELTTSVNIPEGGSVTPAGGVYDHDSEVTLTAEPSPDYVFIGWSGDVSGKDTTVTVTMDADKVVYANFEATFQEVNYTMLPGISASVVTFSNTVARGDFIEGWVELTGEFAGQDRSFDWTFEIINPEGRMADIFRGHWVNNNHYDFSHEAKYSGTYRIRISHNSLTEKQLMMRIWPVGW